MNDFPPWLDDSMPACACLPVGRVGRQIAKLALQNFQYQIPPTPLF